MVDLSADTSILSSYKLLTGAVIQMVDLSADTSILSSYKL